MSVEIPEYFIDKAGKHRFRVKGENGEIIVSSQGYASKFNAEHGFQALLAACFRHDQFSGEH